MKKALRLIKVLTYMIIVTGIVAAGDLAVEHFAEMNFEATKAALEGAILLLSCMLMLIAIVLMSKDEG